MKTILIDYILPFIFGTIAGVIISMISLFVFTLIDKLKNKHNGTRNIRPD